MSLAPNNNCIAKFHDGHEVSDRGSSFVQVYYFGGGDRDPQFLFEGISQGDNQVMIESVLAAACCFDLFDQATVNQNRAVSCELRDVVVTLFKLPRNRSI